MMSKFKPLEIYDLSLPDIPKRSRLYNLEPIGISTPDVESLTGYIARLAQTHCMSTGQLICRELMPILKPEYASDITDIYKNFLSEEQSRAYNGTGLMANSVVNACYTLTGCNKLQFLTLLAFREVLYPKDLFRTFKAWCPICYQQWQMKGQVLFEPLIWSFNQVTICQHHLQLLQTNCPHCQKWMYLIEWNSRPGYCSKCGAWLGTLTSETQELSEKEIESQLWIIRNIGKLIATASSLSSTPKREIIAKSINDYINQLTSGNPTAFAQICGISHGGLFKWITGKSIPTLTKALQICSCLNIELIDLLNGQICELSNDTIVSLLTSHQQSKIRQYEEKPQIKPLGLRKIEQELLKALKEYPPKSGASQDCKNKSTNGI